MTTFLAIIFVCAAGVPVQACDETTALDVRSVRVANEIGCTGGWQEIIARAPSGDGLAEGSYLKTACKRQKPS